MKLATLALVITLGLGGAAYADRGPERGQFRQLLLERFDRNHDGRLEPQERRRAARALRKLARKLEMQGQRGFREAWRDEWRHARARALRRFDSNGNGVVGPEEMRPGMARRLRPLDRNRDGWIDERSESGGSPRPDRSPHPDRSPPGDRSPRPDSRPPADSSSAPDGDRDPDQL